MKIRSGIFAGALALAIGLGIAGAHADTTLRIDDSSGNIGTVDVNTQAVTVIGNSGQILTDLGFTANGSLYGTTFTGLYSINQSTGVATFIGNYIVGNGGMNGLLGSGANLLASSSTTNLIYSVSPGAPGSATNYALSPYISAGDLAFANGVLYESIVDPGTGNDALANINTDSIIGDFSGDLTNLYGLAYSNGVMYGIGGTEIYSVNLATAGLTPLFNYSASGLGAANGAAVLGEAAVPEPSSLLMLIPGLGMIFGALYLARKKALAS
jgi:hypothetical protein